MSDPRSATRRYVIAAVMITLLVVAFVIVVIMLLNGRGPQQTATEDTGSAPTTAESASSSPQPVQARFVRVLDGDTITVAATEDLPATPGHDGEHVVDLRGIEALGSPACGPSDAREQLQSLVSPSMQVRLVPVAAADAHSPSSAYVEIVDNDEDLGARMVEAGFAKVTDDADSPRQGEYQSLEDKAQGRGLWPMCEQADD